MAACDKKNGVIESSAPVRINDLGGWTDTWFSKHGRVLSISVRPGATCRLEYTRNPPPHGNRFTLDVLNFGERYSFDPSNPPLERHPLLEAAVSSVGIPDGTAVEARVGSEMPPGCGTGTSAAVVVALLGALAKLAGRMLNRESLWRCAHAVETERLGWQSGIQDQICAAYGGICYIDIYEYPEAEISRLDLSGEIIRELEKCLVLVYLGTGHRSTDVHHSVIRRLAEEGSRSAQLNALRGIPTGARDALTDGDLDLYGELMIANNECQRSLHPGLVSPEANRVIDVARKHGARGWKVNGAGGGGGSVTILAGDGPGSKDAMLEEIALLGGGIRHIIVRMDRTGLRVIRRS